MSARRRLPFSAALVALVVVVAGATGAMLGILAWQEKRAGARALTDTAMEQVATLLALSATRAFRDAEPFVRAGQEMVGRGLLDPGNTAAVERYTIAVLAANPRLMWVIYGDRDERHVAARRDDSNNIYVRRGTPRNGRIRLVEEQLLQDGRRELIRDIEEDYRPTRRPYYQAAQAARRLIWTDPYEFFSGGFGISCAGPVFDKSGAVRGVFNIDISLEEMSRSLESLRISPNSRMYIATAAGEIVAGPRPVNEEHRKLVGDLVRKGDAGGLTVMQSGERLLIRAKRFAVSGQEWRVAVLVPERDFTEQIDRQAMRAALLAALALAVAAGLGIALSRWISRPLRALGGVARRISRGDLDVEIVPDSSDEIGTLAQTLAEMVKGLRDRDFIRDVLGRYVSQELAEQCLRDRDAIRLGGELRTVSILMTDLRGFSALSERLGPEAMIGLLNRYLARMVPIILEHHGTINEFIGDAILALFGAPVERPDDAARAVRCAWCMQQAMVAFNAESRAAGLPELTMGVGLHTGRVVAGNIGSADRVKYGVVGPAVNIAGRIESLTVGPQILLSHKMRKRVGDLARVGPGREVDMKGMGERFLVYELQGVAGEGASVRDVARMADVDLRALCYRLDGKQVVEPPFQARITRMGVQGLRFETA